MNSDELGNLGILNIVGKEGGNEYYRGYWNLVELESISY